MRRVMVSIVQSNANTSCTNTLITLSQELPWTLYTAGAMLFDLRSPLYRFDHWRVKMSALVSASISHRGIMVHVWSLLFWQVSGGFGVCAPLGPNRPIILIIISVSVRVGTSPIGTLSTNRTTQPGLRFWTFFKTQAYCSSLNKLSVLLRTGWGWSAARRDAGWIGSRWWNGGRPTEVHVSWLEPDMAFFIVHARHGFLLPDYQCAAAAAAAASLFLSLFLSPPPPPSLSLPLSPFLFLFLSLSLSLSLTLSLSLLSFSHSHSHSLSLSLSPPFSPRPPLSLPICTQVQSDQGADQSIDTEETKLRPSIDMKLTVHNPKRPR